MGHIWAILGYSGLPRPPWPVNPGSRPPSTQDLGLRYLRTQPKYSLDIAPGTCKHRCTAGWLARTGGPRRCQSGKTARIGQTEQNGQDRPNISESPYNPYGFWRVLAGSGLPGPSLAPPGRTPWAPVPPPNTPSTVVGRWACT